MPRKKKKKKIDKIAPTGRVITQDIMIPPITLKSSAPIPLAKPTPITAPTTICIVETGIPVREAITTVAAAANSAENPRVGTSSVILVPIVNITR